MGKQLTDDYGLIHAFNALYDLATPRQRELFKQDEIKPQDLPPLFRPGAHIPYKNINGTDYVELDWLTENIKPPTHKGLS